MSNIDIFENNPFGEGFYADKVVNEKNVELGKKYFVLLGNARKVIKTGAYSPDMVEALHRYNRIFSWLHYQYGDRVCGSAEATDIFIKSKLFDLMMFEGDCWLFWEWLREETLRESSLKYGGQI